MIVPRLAPTHVERDTDLPRTLGWYLWLPAYDEAKPWAIFRCSQGHDSTIGKPHTIAADGSCSPSFVGPTPGCTFHEFVQLADWPADMQKRAGTTVPTRDVA